jgi:hypothetical protein
MRCLTIAAALAAAMTAPAVAQTTMIQPPTAAPQVAAAQQQPAAKPAKRRMICEEQERIGSRLGGHKVCRYADEAQNNRADTRMQVERAQAMIQAPHGN